MVIRTFSILIVAVSLSFFGAMINRTYSAPIDEALKTLKGLTGNERLTRVENEARKEGSVRWASSTPQAWAEPALQIFRKRYPPSKLSICGKVAGCLPKELFANIVRESMKSISLGPAR